MKRILLLAVLALAGGVFALIGSCSHPLESTDINGGPVPPPPIVRVDTLVIIDTVMIIDTGTVIDTVVIFDTLVIIDSTATVDTVFIIDTILSFDTLVIYDSTITIDTVVIYDSTITIDTVVIIEPGTGGPLFVCASLSSSLKEIIWMFRNDGGRFLLEFAATTERDEPGQMLTVEIGGQEYQWDPGKDKEFIIEQDLEENATIRITPKKPPSYGHDITICLTMTKM